jgi:murein L,D-transpeptidase YcbB/YkuD
LLALLVGVEPAARSPGAGQPGVTEGVRQRIEHVRLDPRLVVGGDRLLFPNVVAEFFEGRAFSPVWTTKHDAGEAIDAIRRIAADGLTPAHYHLAAIERAREAQGRAATPAAGADLEILVADAVAAIVDHVQFGKVRPDRLDPDWNVDPRATAPPLVTLLDLIAGGPSITDGIARFTPSHFVYEGLKQALARHRQVAAGGGWPTVPHGPPLKPGVSDPRVVALRARLAVTGELAAPADVASPLYDESLGAAVKRFQELHRLTPDGAVGRATFQALGVSAASRTDQIRVNLERARWVLQGLRDTFVLVNLPAFKVYLIRDRRVAWDARAQVGRTARKTPSFRDDIEYIVFNPDWIVPPTILAQDVLAPMKRGDDAIRRKKLEIIDERGRRVEPSAIDWAAARPGSFRYTLRQPPGSENALGRVKFVFPNEHAVFLHDTPSRELFASDERTFSSGCIRVENALDFARELLQDDPQMTAERMTEIVAAGETKTVFLAQPMPVLIVYWTVTVGTSGEVRFAHDVYAEDPRVLQALDAPPVPGPPS